MHVILGCKMSQTCFHENHSMHACSMCTCMCVCVCVNMSHVCQNEIWQDRTRNRDVFKYWRERVVLWASYQKKSGIVPPFLFICSSAVYRPLLLTACDANFPKSCVVLKRCVCVCVCVHTVFWLHTSPQAAAETVSLDSRERYGELLAKKTLVFQSCWQCSVYYSLSHSLCPILMWSISVVSVNLCFRFPLSCSAALLLARYANRNIVCSNLE